MMNFDEMELATEISQSLKSIADDVDRIESKLPTLRDYFAAKALVLFTIHIAGDGAIPHIALRAYEIADAMMEARKQKPEKAKD